MTNRPRLMSCVAIAIVVVLLVWLRPATKTERQSVLAATNESASSIVGTQANRRVFAPTNEPERPQVSSVSITNLSSTELRSLQIKQAIEGKNVPISFYGRVIDQDSNGLSGVHIVFRVMQPRIDIDFALAKNMPTFERTTDASGNFSVEGITGSDLNIESVSKDGYRLSSKTQTGYRYGPSPVPFNPDPQNPVIIRMWKELASKEPLIIGSHVFGIDSGKTYTLDLIQGKKFAGETAGDLRIAITRPSEVNSKDRYSWSYSIEAVQGGLLEASPDDEFMYLAPETGYEPKTIRQ